MAKTSKIEQKIDQIDQKVAQINVNLAVYNAHLQEHMRRSDLLEESVTLLKQSLFRVISFKDKLTGAFKLFCASGIGAALIKAATMFF